MVDFLMFIIIGFMISITINVALVSVIYIILSNKQQQKYTTLRFRRAMWCISKLLGSTHFCGFSFSIFIIRIFYKMSNLIKKMWINCVAQCQHYTGAAFDVGQRLSDIERNRLYNSINPLFLYSFSS